jgi:hypothetical protein
LKTVILYQALLAPFEYLKAAQATNTKVGDQEFPCYFFDQGVERNLEFN